MFKLKQHYLLIFLISTYVICFSLNQQYTISNREIKSMSIPLVQGTHELSFIIESEKSTSYFFINMDSHNEGVLYETSGAAITYNSPVVEINDEGFSEILLKIHIPEKIGFEDERSKIYFSIGFSDDYNFNIKLNQPEKFVPFTSNVFKSGLFSNHSSTVNFDKSDYKYSLRLIMIFEGNLKSLTFDNKNVSVKNMFIDVMLKNEDIPSKIVVTKKGSLKYIFYFIKEFDNIIDNSYFKSMSSGYLFNLLNSSHYSFKYPLPIFSKNNSNNIQLLRISCDSCTIKNIKYTLNDSLELLDDYNNQDAEFLINNMPKIQDDYYDYEFKLSDNEALKYRSITFTFDIEAKSNRFKAITAMITDRMDKFLNNKSEFLSIEMNSLFSKGIKLNNYLDLIGYDSNMYLYNGNNLDFKILITNSIKNTGQNLYNYVIKDDEQMLIFNDINNVNLISQVNLDNSKLIESKELYMYISLNTLYPLDDINLRLSIIYTRHRYFDLSNTDNNSLEIMLEPYSNAYILKNDVSIKEDNEQWIIYIDKYTDDNNLKDIDILYCRRDKISNELVELDNLFNKDTYSKIEGTHLILELNKNSKNTFLFKISNSYSNTMINISFKKIVKNTEHLILNSDIYYFINPNTISSITSNFSNLFYIYSELLTSNKSKIKINNIDVNINTNTNKYNTEFVDDSTTQEYKFISNDKEAVFIIKLVDFKNNIIELPDNTEGEITNNKLPFFNLNKRFPNKDKNSIYELYVYNSNTNARFNFLKHSYQYNINSQNYNIKNFNNIGNSNNVNKGLYKKDKLIINTSIINSIFDTDEYYNSLYACVDYSISDYEKTNTVKYLLNKKLIYTYNILDTNNYNNLIIKKTGKFQDKKYNIELVSINNKNNKKDVLIVFILTNVKSLYLKSNLIEKIYKDKKNDYLKVENGMYYVFKNIGYFDNKTTSNFQLISINDDLSDRNTIIQSIMSFNVLNQNDIYNINFDNFNKNLQIEFVSNNQIKISWDKFIPDYNEEKTYYIMYIDDAYNPKIKEDTLFDVISNINNSDKIIINDQNITYTLNSGIYNIYIIGCDYMTTVKRLYNPIKNVTICNKSITSNIFNYEPLHLVQGKAIFCFETTQEDEYVVNYSLDNSKNNEVNIKTTIILDTKNNAIFNNNGFAFSIKDYQNLKNNKVFAEIEIENSNEYYNNNIINILYLENKDQVNSNIIVHDNKIFNYRLNNQMNVLAYVSFEFNIGKFFKISLLSSYANVQSLTITSEDKSVIKTYTNFNKIITDLIDHTEINKKIIAIVTFKKEDLKESLNNVYFLVNNYSRGMHLK